MSADNQFAEKPEEKAANIFATAAYVFGAICLAIAAYGAHLLNLPGNDAILTRLLVIEQVFIACLGASVFMMLVWDFMHINKLVDAHAEAIKHAKEFANRRKAWIKWSLVYKEDRGDD